MSITLTTDGYTSILPTGWKITSESQATTTPTYKNDGKRGLVRYNYGQAEHPKKIVISGQFKASTSAALMTAIDSLQSVQGSGAYVYLTESVQGRTIKCLVADTRWAKQVGLIIPGQITLIGVDGVWTDNIGTKPEFTSFTVSIEGATGNSALMEVYYTGSAPTRPSLNILCNSVWANPQIEWYGGNLVKNSSFADMTDGATVPDNWNVQTAQGIKWDNSVGYSDNFSVRMEGTAATNVWHSDTFSVLPSTDYTVSLYARANSVESLTYMFQWHDNAAAATNGVFNVTNVATGDWVRYSYKDTSPADASSALIRLRILSTTAVGETVWVDDVMVNQGETANTYFNTNIARNKHTTISRTSGFDADDQLQIDMENGHAMRYDTSAETWYDDNYETNGRYFELMPGYNYVRFAYADDAAELSVRMQHDNRYY